MPEVPILVFEDAVLANSKELRERVPKQASNDTFGYSFCWHLKYNALGGINQPQPLLISSTETFQEAMRFLRHELSGEAIVVLDLQLKGSTDLTPQQISDELFDLVARLDQNITDKKKLLHRFNPGRLGLLLGISAAQNPNWRGMIVFASGRDVIQLDQLQKCVPTQNRIAWRDLRRSFSADGASPLDDRLAALNGIIAEFLQRQSGPDFWPTNTENWFKDINSVPPHPVPHESNAVVVKLIREYLEGLLGDFSVPENWFKDSQWTNLYETLKGLIGASSVCCKGDKNLRLPAIPFLLAAQMAWKKNDINWLKSFVWDLDDVVEVMSHKNPADAREAIRAMAAFLEELGLGNEGTQVIGVSWGKVDGDQKKHLWIDFKFDPLSRANGKGLLPTIFGARWGNEKGQTVRAYENMMEKARVDQAPPLFSLCIYPVYLDQEGPFTRLDFRALKG
jgi:hypothetical protein